MVMMVAELAARVSGHWAQIQKGEIEVLEAQILWVTGPSVLYEGWRDGMVAIT
jgi:hypothetical protein